MLRPVLFKRWIKSEGVFAGGWSDFIHEGLFHQWVIQHQEYESGPGNYTVAIIELPDGTLEEVYPSRMKFKTPPFGTTDATQQVEGL